MRRWSGSGATSFAPIRLPLRRQRSDPLIDGLRRNLGEVLDFVRAQNPGITLVVVNLPDLARRRISRRRIRIPSSGRESLRRPSGEPAITDLAAARGIGVADVFAETDRLVAAKPSDRPVDLYPGRKRTTIRDINSPAMAAPEHVPPRPSSPDESLRSFNEAYATGIRASRIGRSSIWWASTRMQPYGLGVATPFRWKSADDPDQDGWANLVEFGVRFEPTRQRPLTRSPSVRPVLPSWSGAGQSQIGCLGGASSPSGRSICVLAAGPGNQLNTASDARVTISLPANAGARFRSPSGLDADRPMSRPGSSLHKDRGGDVHEWQLRRSDPRWLCAVSRSLRPSREFSRSPRFRDPFVATYRLTCSNGMLSWPGTGLTRSSTTRGCLLKSVAKATNHHVRQLAGVGGRLRADSLRGRLWVMARKAFGRVVCSDVGGNLPTP